MIIIAGSFSLRFNNFASSLLNLIAVKYLSAKPKDNFKSSFKYLKIDPSAKLVLVGDGDLKKSIKKKIDDLNISDSVVFTGIVPNVNEIAQCFDVFCFPSLFEGLSVAMVEIQATGVKSVISDTISKECIITDNVEMLPIDANPKIWADKLITFKGTYIKKNMLDSVEKANFDIKKNAMWLQEFYLNEYNNKH